ncbi:MAG: hypothetical protein JNL58_00135 [Planctomyces sp.]|nr:hypothetical protein [Planctomyces sp.]
MAPVQSVSIQVTPPGQSNVNVVAPLRRMGQIQPIDVPGEGSCAGVGLTSGNGFGRGITVPGVQAHAQLQLYRNAAGWKFGFIQFLRFQVFDVVYRGVTPADGSVFLQFYPTSEQNRLMLDQAQEAEPGQPWYHPLSVQTATASHHNLLIPFNDTPADFIECRRMNPVASRFPVSNWLHHVWLRLQFTTVLAAKSPTGAVEPIQSFDWEVDWNLTFTRGTGPNPDENWAWTPDPCGGKTIGPASRNHLSRHPAIASRFSATGFQMLPIVRAAEGHNREPRISHLRTW